MALVDILLATYNGEKYIAQQISSIQSQTFDDWRLLIHDDGSSDNTLEIIRKIMISDERIVLIEDDVKKGNAADNFMYLIHQSDAPFVMFCDQDDIWFDNKVEKMYNLISSQDASLPQILYSNSTIWDSENDVRKGSATITFPQKLSHLLFLNSGIQGCVSIFNKKTVNLMKLWNGECAMHDHVLHLIGLSIGNVIYLHESLMLYRQHETNVTGAASGKQVDTKKIIHNYKMPVIDRKHYDSVIRFINIYRPFLSIKSKNIINAYIEMLTYSFGKRISTILKFDFRIYDSKIKLILKLILRPFI